MKLDEECKMRILMFIPALNAGGAERVMVTLANYLAESGHDIMIQTLNTDESFYAVSDKVKITGMSYSFSGNSSIRKLQIPVIEAERGHTFIRAALEYRPDVILSFLYTTNIIALLARNRLKAPLVISERNDPLAVSPVNKKICAKLYPKADLIVCQGNKVAAYFENIHGKCEVIANPLNPQAVGEFKSKKTKEIVTVGRLIPQKNHRLLIKAFSELHLKYPDYSLKIVGEGPLKSELEDLIDTLKLRDAVLIQSNVRNVMTVINDAACFVLPSDYEGFPNVLLEAMASGMPVVSTDFGTGIARDLIIDGKNGYVVPIEDTKKMADAIERIIVSENIQIQMGKENLKLKDQFSEGLICSRWEDALSKVAGISECSRK